jgi:phosphoadenosine phosphosulfate reductase
MSLNQNEIEAMNAELEALPTEERIAWAWDRFGAGLILSTSFGLQSSVMLNLVFKVSSEIPIVFVDTGYLFPETYQYALALQGKIGFRVKTYSSKMSSVFQEIAFGKLWEQGRDGMQRYNFLNKKEPMERALRELGATAWLSGLRRAQSSEREKRPFIETQDNIVKIYPILDWSDRATYQYLPQNDLPYHPLEGMGYDSLGDRHSTQKIDPSKSTEGSRHGGHGRECGLHLDSPEGLDFDLPEGLDFSV